RGTEKYLLCYYITNENIEGNEIRSYLKSKLPTYMIPSYYKRIDNIPITRNGKLDRKALPEPDMEDIMAKEYIAPETEIEKTLCSIFSNVFSVSVEKIGRTSDFFEMGGNSINAIKVSTMIEKELKTKINIKNVLSNPIITDLAMFIENKLSENELSSQYVIKKSDSKEFPVTSQQLGVYIDSIKHPESIMYNIPSSYKLSNDINIEKLKEGLLHLFREQEILRSKYYEKENNGKFEIYGYIDDECMLEFEEYDSIESAKSFVRPFDLSKAPLIRVGFINNEILLIDLHHIISDGTTNLIILNEINKYYNDGSIEKLDIQFKDYAIDIKEKKDNGYYDEEIEFYQNMFDCGYDLLKIPKKNQIMDNDENSNVYEKNNLTREIDENVCKKINEYIKLNGISKTAFFLSIYGFILSKYSGQDKIYTSVISSNRNNHYVENMIGMFVGTQPLLLNYENDDYSLVETIKSNMNTLIDIYDHQNLSFSELIAELNLKRINNAFVYQPKSVVQGDMNKFTIINNNDINHSMNIINFEKNNDNSNTSKFELSFYVVEDKDYYSISIEYNSYIYDSFMINNILDSYIEVIGNLDQFHNKIYDIEYIPSSEKTKILSEFNKNSSPYEDVKFYHEEFSEVAKIYSDRCAVIFNGQEFTYKMIDEMSNSLAHFLRENGIQRNDVVPLICDRSIYYIVGFIGILKSGGAYLTVDPEFPRERIEYMMNEVNAKVYLKYIEEAEKNKKLMFENYNGYSLDKIDYNKNKSSINNINEENDLCYILFTSGTTGKPKGTLIGHNSLYNFCKYGQKLSNGEDVYGEDINNVLAFINFTFDMTIGEIHYPLLRGCTIVLCSNEDFYNPDLLADLITKNNIKYIWSVPSRLQNYISLSNKFKNALKNVKWLLYGGEKIKKNLYETIQSISDIKIFNGYGPTEATVLSTIKIFGNKKIIQSSEELNNIGRPLRNYKVYILDKHKKPVPVGVIGEIYIGGYGVGKGYLNREELTKEKFIENPFNYSNDKYCKKMYDTGDLGKWTTEGEIVCLGRSDDQVKIHGQRIEVSEIENTIKEMDGIQISVVIDKEKGTEKYLLCYYITNKNIEGNEIRSYLKSKLPTYMIPSYYKRIENLPVNRNGKLDKRALPEPDMNEIINKEYVAPETEVEKSLCSIFSNVFNIDIEKVGRTSDFFEMGGNSINAIKVSTMIEKELKLKINIRNILSNSVITELAIFIENKLSENELSSQYVIKKSDSKEFPVTSQQLGVYIDSIKHPESIMYNIPSSYKLSNNINIEKLKEGLLQLFREQEILRSKYYEKENNGKFETYGYIDDECMLEFEEYDSIESAKSFVRPFDLSKAPLIRVGFINNEILLIDLHHIISDGTTNLIVLNELNKYYNDGSIEKLDIQFKDYAIDIKEKKDSGYYDKEIEFYKNMFDCDYDLLNIPKKNQTMEISRDSDENISEKNNIIRDVDENVCKKINEYIKLNGISKTAFFLSIYGFILSKYSGQDKIYTSVISSNRNNHYVENMIGMFVGTQPLLLNYENEDYSLVETIKRNMTTVIDIYDHQDLSFSELTGELNLKKINNAFIYQPKSVVQDDMNKFAILDNNDISHSMNIINFEKNNDNSNMSKFEILFYLVENKDYYSISVDYNANIYDSLMINSILDSYIEVLGNLDQFNNKIYDIEYIPSSEKTKIISEFNQNSYPYEDVKFYHEEFKKVAEMYPDKCAIVFNEQKITYKMLDEMSNSVAHFLREIDISRNDVVPLICDRSFYYIVGFLGVMKSGAAYLTIDPEFPRERIEYMMNEVNAKIYLKYIVDNEQDNTMEFENYHGYSLDKLDYNTNKSSINNINKENDLCYILFTSGTTGKPKGTLIGHNNLVNYCLYSQKINGEKDIYGDDFDVELAFSKFTFDMSVVEIHYPLLRGGTIVLCNNEEFNNPSSIGDLIIKNNVKCVWTVPSRLQNYIALDHKFKEVLTNVKWIGFGGEKVTRNLLESVYSIGDIVILNGYGPTETTVIGSMKIFNNNKSNDNGEELITIGKPSCNYKVYILDKHLKPVPIGVEGEIYMGGYGVGKGYLNREELTKERYVENPFNFTNDKYCKIMYKTGDLGKWTPNGETIYLGRSDDQVKIRGQRIEVSEIENTIKEMNGIKNSVVIDKQKGNDSYLLCYYITNENIEGNEIREFLKSKLPTYMIPSYYKRIDNLPITRNGKLDRKALPEPDMEDIINKEYVAPETEIEKSLCSIYSKIFNINYNEVGRLSDFIEMGGNSFNAIKVIAEINNTFNIKIKIRDIINHATVKDLASFIENIESNDNKNEVIIKRSINVMEYPITPLLSGLVYDTDNLTLNQLKQYTSNMVQFYKLNNAIDIEKLNEAMNIIINRHAVLKSYFIEKEIDRNKKIYGKVRENVSFEVEKYTEKNFYKFIRPFDITKDVLIRVGLINKSILMIDMDHRISDGYSFGILIKELYNLYNNKPLNELPIQYMDYAIEYDERSNSESVKEQLKYYQSMFDEPCDRIDLPTKKNNKSKKINEKKKFNSVTMSTDKETYDIINSITKKYNISKTALFLVVYNLVLSMYSGKKNIFNAIISSNRTSENTENLIGIFARYMPILVKIEDINLIDIIKKYMTTILTIINDDISFSTVTKELDLPQCNSWFKFDPYNLMNNDELDMGTTMNPNDILQTLGRKNLRAINNLRKMKNSLDLFTLNNSPDFIFIVSEKKDHYIIKFTYNNEKYENSHISDMLNDFIKIVKQEDNIQKNITDISTVNEKSGIKELKNEIQTSKKEKSTNIFKRKIKQIIKLFKRKSQKSKNN
ncbi:hypothetical protein PIROE2DRAFT_15885, partial [Piromyces sp. E2]